MTTKEILQNLSIILGGTAAGVAAITYLASKLLEKIFARDNERLKSEIQAKFSTELEQFKHDLKRIEYEHQVRYSNLHEEVAKTIAATYPLLYKVFSLAEQLVSPFGFSGQPGKHELVESLSKVNSEFSEYYRNKRIYFPKTLYSQMNAFHLLLVDTCNNFYQDYKKSDGIDLEPEVWNRSWTVIKEEARPLLEKLVDEFQKVLGFASEPAQNNHAADATSDERN